MKTRQFHSFELTHKDFPGSSVVLSWTLAKEFHQLVFVEGSEPQFQYSVFRYLMESFESYDLLKKSPFNIRYISTLDLSFEAFWDHYAYKVGNKSACKKLWNKLPAEDKVLALGFINKYNRWLSKTGYNKVFAERYIKQRRWENQY